MTREEEGKGEGEVVRLGMSGGRKKGKGRKGENRKK